VKFYLMRHAEAEYGMQMDPTRQLTDTGKRQAKMMAKWLSRQTEKPEIVVESNFQRARSTAKRVAKQLDVPLIRSGFLDPENTPENTWMEMKRLATANKVTSLIAVSHGPLVEKLLAHLTGSPLPQQFHFAHAAVAHFDTTGGNRGILHWIVTPNTVARDEDELDLVVHQEATEAAIAVAEAALELVGNVA
jgi:phosphohistidine phosphatase